MRVAYADPPYPGCAHLYPEDTEVDHAELIARLVDEYPDGWALSSHSLALRDLLPLCPPDTRVGTWVKTWCSWKPGVGVAYAWEPVLFRGGRKRGRRTDTVRDWIACPILTQQTVKGAKPDAFCYWLFQVLNLRPGDTLDDLYPGTGRVTRAWERWQRRLELSIPGEQTRQLALSES